MLTIFLLLPALCWQEASPNPDFGNFPHMGKYISFSLQSFWSTHLTQFHTQIMFYSNYPSWLSNDYAQLLFFELLSSFYDSFPWENKQLSRSHELPDALYISESQQP